MSFSVQQKIYLCGMLPYNNSDQLAYQPCDQSLPMLSIKLIGTHEAPS